MSVLRQVEVSIANGKMSRQACRGSGVIEQTHCRWPKGYGGLKLKRAKRLAELSLEKQILQGVARHGTGKGVHVHFSIVAGFDPPSR